MRYTTLGTGDFTPDYPEDTRPQCLHCNEHFDSESGEKNEEYCGQVCWHLSNIGQMKQQILSWYRIGFDSERIIRAMDKGLWFEGMTDSTVERYKRVISKQA